MKRILLTLAAALAFPILSTAQTTTTPGAPLQNLYMGGVAYNPSGTPSVAGNALYAHLVANTSTYAFTSVDLIPASVKPFTVNTSIAAGVAQKFATVAGVDAYGVFGTGLTVSGTATGWNFSGGVILPFKLKPYKGGNWYVAPEARFAKASVGGSGYQVIAGVDFGWGQ